jgi:hypothetical protein
MKPAELYDRDFYRWTVQNAGLRRAGRASLWRTHFACSVHNRVNALQFARELCR